VAATTPQQSTALAALPVESFRLRVLDSPTGRRDFLEFRCGDDSLRFWVGKRIDRRRAVLRPKQQAVIELHDIARRLARGRADPQVVIGLENLTLEKLVGFCGIRTHTYTGAYRATVRATYYINVLGRAEAFKRLCPEPGVTSGFVLVRGALEQIAVWGEGTTPAVWALVWEDNDQSLPLFTGNGFATFAPEEPGCQTVQYRRAGLEVPAGALVLENPPRPPPLPS
jgi:hypothetical protein